VNWRWTTAIARLLSKKVSFKLKQVVKQRIGHHSDISEIEIISQTVSGPAAEEGNWK